MGSAQLLMSQKFQQFYWLCQQNMVSEPWLPWPVPGSALTPDTLSAALFLKDACQALAAVAQCVEHVPANPRVAGSIPSQGTCLGCKPGPQ